MEPKSLASTMFDLQRAIENCDAANPINVEWGQRHRASLRALCKLLPSGSGVDNGTTLTRIRTTPGAELIELGCSFHHMDEQGSYDGWTEHTIRIRPSFSGLNVTISGPDRDGIKEHLHEIYSLALSEHVHYLDGRWVSTDVQIAPEVNP